MRHVRNAILDVDSFPGRNNLVIEPHGAVDWVEHDHAFYMGALFGEPNSDCARMYATASWFKVGAYEEEIGRLRHAAE